MQSNVDFMSLHCPPTKKKKPRRKTCCSSITLDPASSCNIGISRSGLFYRVSPILILPTVSSHTGTRFHSSVFCHAPQPLALITVACRAALVQSEQPSVYKHVHVLSCVHLLSCIISTESCLAQLLPHKHFNKQPNKRKTEINVAQHPSIVCLNCGHLDKTSIVLSFLLNIFLKNCQSATYNGKNAFYLDTCTALTMTMTVLHYSFKTDR